MNLLEINLSMSCNFTCAYCVAGAVQGGYCNKYGQLNHIGAILDLEETLAYVARHFKPDEWAIEISGGEPLFVPGFRYFVNDLLKMNYKVLVLTNGSNYQAASFINPKCHFLLTHHIEQVSFEKFAEAVEFYKRTFRKLWVSSVIHSRGLAEKWYKTEQRKLKTLGLPFDLVGVQNVVNKELGRFMDFHDEAYWEFEDAPVKPDDDFRLVSIIPTGDVRQCHGEFKSCGNVYEGTFLAEKVKPQKCQFDPYHTQCSAENTFRKVFDYYRQENARGQ
jgi:organic radical activating enzyme